MKFIRSFILLALVATSGAAHAGAYANPNRYSGVIIGTSSQTILAPGKASVFLDINNDSATATIACAFGTAAVVNGAGSVTIAAMTHRQWDNNFVPSDQINCISSVAATPITFGFN